MTTKKKVCIITGSRADYGLLKLVIQEISESKVLDLQLLVTGTHLSPLFGNTYKEIEKDGFLISHKIDILKTEDDIAYSMSKALTVFTEIFLNMRPDLVIVLGDRYEIFAAAIAAYISKIPIAHIHGGESTQGAFDEGFRHAITKMSYLHFASTEIYKKRIIQLGESPDRVFNFGSPGIEAIKKIKLYNKEELSKLLGISFGEKNILVTLHPETLNRDISVTKQVTYLLSALKTINGVNIIFTKANADPGGLEINREIDKFVHEDKSIYSAFESLGQKKYFSLLQYIDGVVGNSSSGIIEVPIYGIGTVNIGDRQKGRVKSHSVIDVGFNSNDIKSSILKLFDKRFVKKIQSIESPYEGKNTSKKIIQVVKDHLSREITTKYFYDL